jgi:hypothetical protein
MHQSCAHTSANTGVAPTCTAAQAVANQVRAQPPHLRSLTPKPASAISSSRTVGHAQGMLGATNCSKRGRTRLLRTVEGPLALSEPPAAVFALLTRPGPGENGLVRIGFPPLAASCAVMR